MLVSRRSRDIRGGAVLCVGKVRPSARRNPRAAGFRSGLSEERKHRTFTAQRSSSSNTAGRSATTSSSRRSTPRAAGPEHRGVEVAGDIEPEREPEGFPTSEATQSRAGGSLSRMPNCSLNTSASGQWVIPSPYERQRPKRRIGVDCSANSRPQTRARVASWQPRHPHDSQALDQALRRGPIWIRVMKKPVYGPFHIRPNWASLKPRPAGLLPTSHGQTGRQD